jgi:hypothetical protein
MIATYYLFPILRAPNSINYFSEEKKFSTTFGHSRVIFLYYILAGLYKFNYVIDFWFI